MARLRIGNVHGVLTASILSTDTTFRITYDATSNTLPALSGSDFYALTLEPDTLNQEIIWVTSIATTPNGDGSYTINTCTRHQENTSAVAHNGGKTWLHGPTITDFVGGSGGSVGLLGPVTFAFNNATVGTPFTLFSGLNAGQVISNITGFVNTAFNNSATFDLGTDTHTTFFVSASTAIQTQDSGAGTEIQAAATAMNFSGDYLINTGNTSIVATLHGSPAPTQGSVVFYAWVT